MRTLTGLVLLFLTLSHAAHGFQDRESLANEDVLNDQAVYYYLPLKSSTAKSNPLKGGLPVDRQHWNPVATHGVQFIDTDDEISGTLAKFDGMSLVELDGSSRFDSQSLSVELWFRSDQVWDAKYWPGSATLVSKFTSGWASSDWGIIGGSLNDGVNEGRILVGVGPSGGGDVVLASPPGLNDGRYHHLVWTHSVTGEDVLYIDGKEADRA